MNRFYVVLIAACLMLVGCKESAPADGARTPADKALLGTSNGLSLAIDSAAVLFRDATLSAGRAEMARCPALDAGRACREDAVTRTVAEAKPTAARIDAATKLQHTVADLVVEREKCKEAGDLVCAVNLSAKLAPKLPELLSLLEQIKADVTKAAGTAGLDPTLIQAVDQLTAEAPHAN